MNHAQHKLLTTVIVFVILVVGILLGFQFKEVSLGAMNTALLLVNSMLLLIILAIILYIKENFNEKTKKRDRV